MKPKTILILVGVPFACLFGAGLFMIAFYGTQGAMPHAEPTAKEKCNKFMALMADTKMSDRTPNDYKTIEGCSAILKGER